MKTLFLLAFTLLLGGCAGSIDSSLWQPLPKQIVLTEDLKIAGIADIGSATITLPKGIYTFFGKNPYGYVYTEKDSRIFVEKTALGRFSKKEFLGGLFLSNRKDVVMIVHVMKSETDLSENTNHMGGEVGAYFVGKELKEEGFLLRPLSKPLSDALRARVGLRTSKQ